MINLKEILGNVSVGLERRLQFIEETEKKDHRLKPKPHQLLPSFDFLNEDRKRALCAYVTGSGKTLTALSTKAHLDAKLGKEAKTLIFAPSLAIRTAWAQEEIDDYYQNSFLMHML